MIQSYLKVAVRHILKGKVFAFINILGLAVGIAAFFLIVQYVSFEMSYDQFHVNKNEVYRIALEQYENGELKNTSARNYSGINDLLKRNCPEVLSTTRFMKIPANTGFLFRYDNKIYNELGGEISADTNFFNVFPSLLLRGNASTILKNPNSLIISESIAKKVFGDADPIGQRIDPMNENRDGPYVVTGILRDIPANSHLHMKFVVRLEDDWPEIIKQDWGSTFVFSYATISKEADMATLVNKVNFALDKVSNENPQVKGAKVFLQPIEDIHLKSNLKDEYAANGNAALIYILAGIALVILAIAWINYINISIARFGTRAKEIGVRRIIGSAKSDLILQFLIEYLLMNAMACALAGLLVFWMLPSFSDLSGIPLHEIKWSSPEVWISACVVFVAGSILVGTYPAVFLLRLNPAATIKGQLSDGKRGGFIRKTLVTVQFVSSMILIAFLVVINSQLNYMRQTNKKIDVEKVIAVRNPTAYSNQEVEDKHDNFKVLEQRLLQDPAIRMVSTSSAIPGAEIGFTFVDLIKRNKSDPYDPTRFKTIFVGANYIPLYGIKIMAGRNFRSDHGNEWKDPWAREDWKKIILNEKAIHALGFASPEEAVNQVIQFHLWGEDFDDYEIIGVTEDFHHEAASKEVYPMIFSVNYNSFQQVYYSISVSSGSNPLEVLAYIQKSWMEIFPERPFDYFFLDDYYDQQFKSELHFSRIFTLFAGIAIFIACLGILGMTLFEASVRRREISIRKVLGASVANLLSLLARDHVRIITWAVLISIPLIWIMASEWLATYPSRIKISPGFFLIPIMVIVVMVGLTSSFQIWRTANTNPVDHLRNE